MMNEGRKKQINRVRDLDVYKLSFDTAVDIFKITKKFPAEEKIFFNRSNKKIIEISLFKPGRGLEKEKI